MSIKESQFDQLGVYSLRIELFNGRVLIYRIDTANKQYLINKLGANSEGFEENKNIVFLWFETSLVRQVMINTKEIIRVTFLVDYLYPDNFNAYYDNFQVIEKDTSIVPKEIAEGDTRLYVLDEEYLPQAIIYHKGKSPEDDAETNPLLYFGLEEGCLGTFGLELDDEVPLRQFINLIDNDGEETFISLEQVIVMEFDKNLLFDPEQDEAFESNFQFNEELDEAFDADLQFDKNREEAFDINLLFDKDPDEKSDGNSRFDEKKGKSKEEGDNEK